MLVPFPDHGEIPIFPDRMMIQATFVHGSIHAAALTKKTILWRRDLMKDLKKEAKPLMSCITFPVIQINIQPRMQLK